MGQLSSAIHSTKSILMPHGNEPRPKQALAKRVGVVG